MSTCCVVKFFTFDSFDPEVVVSKFVIFKGGALVDRIVVLNTMMRWRKDVRLYADLNFLLWFVDARWALRVKKT